MTTEPIENPQDPDAAARFANILQSLREEGGATKENLILAAIGYVCPALDVLQELLPKGDKLPLTAAQLRAVHYVTMDIAVSCARFAAKLAVAGESVKDWADITDQEAHTMTHAILSGMIHTHQPQPAPANPDASAVINPPHDTPEHPGLN